MTMQIKLIKIQSLDNHSCAIPLLTEIVGEIDTEPRLGYTFEVKGKAITSKVEKIISPCEFQTMHSIYKWHPISSTDSEIGSEHWFRTLLIASRDIGVFLRSASPPSSTILKIWGNDLFNHNQELLIGLDIINHKKKIEGTLPLSKEHICFNTGHAMYLVTETDNGRSKFGYHKCSRCGYEESFQYDYN